MLLLPALATIFTANRMADYLHPLVSGVLDSLIANIDAEWPSWLRIVLTAKRGEFGYEPLPVRLSL